MKPLLLALLLLTGFALSALGFSAPIEISVNTLQGAELTAFQVDTTQQNPIIVRYTLSNTGNAFLETDSALFLEQEMFKQKIFLEKDFLEVKETKHNEAFIDVTDIPEGVARLTLVVEASSKKGTQLIEKSVNVAINKEGLGEKNRLELRAIEEITGAAGSTVLSDLRVWNNSGEDQKIFIFAKTRQDLFESRIVEMKAKTRKSVGIAVTVPENGEDINILAVNRFQQPFALKLPVVEITPSSGLLALEEVTMDNILSTLLLSVAGAFLLVGAVYYYFKVKVERHSDAVLARLERALGEKTRILRGTRRKPTHSKSATGLSRNKPELDKDYLSSVNEKLVKGER